MKLFTALPLAAFAAAWVVPDGQVLGHLAIEDHHDPPPASFWDRFPAKADIIDKLRSKFGREKEGFESTFDDVVSRVEDTAEHLVEKLEEEAFNVNAWLQDAIASEFDFSILEDEHPHPPDHGPPGKRPKHPHHPPGHRRPHHPPHHGKPNETIYQLISKSKYTTKLAKLIDQDEDLVRFLNSSKVNTTLFAPTDHAFEKIPPHAPEPPREVIKKILLYHCASGIYPAGRILFEHTVPTALEEPLLDAHQRISARLTFKGVTLNMYSHVIAANIPATNGIIHGIDSVLLPPPKAIKIIQFLPSEFSTLTLGLTKTGLLEVLNSTDHVGGTFFAPSNSAFRKLGPKINAFLFSKYGEKYLKTLLKYHVVPNQTLYSTAFVNKTTALDFGLAELQSPIEEHHCPHMLEHEWDEDDSDRPDEDDDGKRPHHPPHHPEPPRSYFHFDLPTLLDGRTVSADLVRWGPFVSFKVNGLARIVVKDGVAKDGVIQVPSDVLIPPRKLPGGALAFWDGQEMDLQEFKERLLPYVEDDAGWEGTSGESVEL